jgi:AcrR family transcriptional regulator
MVLPEKQIKDRRIEKTRGLLHEALASLIRERAYDSITVQEILDRANVGRSTFYMHFRDKDELLCSGIHGMLGSLQKADRPSSVKELDRIIWFSLPVFEHIYGHRRNSEAKMGPKELAIIHEHLQKVLVELIADDVRGHFQGHGKSANRAPPDLLAQHVASTFILVLNWWLERRGQLAPEEVNDLFRALIVPTLTQTLLSSKQ